MKTQPQSTLTPATSLHTQPNAKTAGAITCISKTMLARLCKERAFLAARSRASRLELRDGQSAIVRFLPARLGTRKMWYARIATHRWGAVSVTCPRLTGDDFGGKPDSPCLLCGVAEALSTVRQAEIADLGSMLRAELAYFTYCVLIEMEDRRLPAHMLLRPFEFWLPEQAWLQLQEYYVAGGRKCAASLLDYRAGNECQVSRTQAGYSLTLLTSVPIFDIDARFERYVSTLRGAMPNPTVVMPTSAQIQMLASAALRLLPGRVLPGRGAHGGE